VSAVNAMGLPPSGFKPDHYLRVYEQLFEPIRTGPIAFLELGVLTGGSLKCWESYFPAGRIAGIDLNVPAAEFGERVRVYAGSQNDIELLSRVAAEVAPDGFDVIIDDCAHIGALAKASFWHLFENHLKPGGLYCIEDWGTGYWPTWPDGRELVVEPDSERRMPSHDAGMVGFIKQLIDEVHIDAVREGFYEPPPRQSKFASMKLYAGLAIVRKVEA